MRKNVQCKTNTLCARTRKSKTKKSLSERKKAAKQVIGLAKLSSQDLGPPIKTVQEGVQFVSYCSNPKLAWKSLSDFCPSFGNALRLSRTLDSYEIIPIEAWRQMMCARALSVSSDPVKNDLEPSLHHIAILSLTVSSDSKKR